MSGVLLGSALEEAVKRLPKALKPEAVVPALKKAGVKDEELQLSGIGVKLPEYLQALPKDDKGRVLGQEVADFTTAFRTDNFSTRHLSGTSTKYDEYTLPHVKTGPSKFDYKERVYEFASPNSVMYGSGHFNYDANYLMHTRLWDDTLDGMDTRVIGEVQSDLHQNDKTVVKGHSEETLGDITKYLTYLKGLQHLPGELANYNIILNNAFTASNTGLTKDQRDAKVKELMTLALSGADEETIAKAVKTTYAPKQKEAAWKTSWARKGLENEIKIAIKEGKQQIAVPIKNANMNSSIYTESDIAALRSIDMRKAVSEYQAGGTIGKRLRDILIEQVPTRNKQITDALDIAGDTLEDSLRYGDHIDSLPLDNFFGDDYIEHLNEVMSTTEHNPIGSMVRGTGVQKWYETNVSPTVQKLAKQLGTNYKTVEKDGVEYAVIDLTTPGVKEKADSAFKLYAGGGVLAYYLAAAQGYTPSEISGYMEEQGFSEDEIANAKANWKKAREAKKAGKSDDEINAMFDTQLTIKE